ncbi:MAG: recJ [Bacteroidetes bacterium]|nr:recJ [Bacteroidota bacterium]
MPRLEKRWSLRTADENKVADLYQSLKVHPALCRILALRGIETYDEAKAFFRPSLDSLHDPFLMKGMPNAVNRITDAISNGEKILIYGDYDVDGTTSVALVYSFLLTIYPNIDYYIPDRYIEGYGISTRGIDYAAENNFTLIIALDCGIKSNDKVDYASSRGIDFIICDHHTPGTEAPAAVAVLDPKQEDCPYPYKELSGCGIGFKLIQAFAQQQGIPLEKVYYYLDLVCVSIASDIVPITGENRILAYHGLQRINTSPCAGIKALIGVATLYKRLDISDIVFIIGPRINAAGRIADGKFAVKLLICTEEDLASDQHADVLDRLNHERKELDKSITEQALDMIATDEVMLARRSTVLYYDGWHKGVIGIVASRLIENYFKPTIVLTLSDGKVTGSGRSVKGFDLYEAIYECREHLIQFGGHKYAAGLTMLPDKVQDFSDAFEKIVQERITPEQLIPVQEIDAEISPDDIDQKFYNIIRQMAPFGPGNMKPVFLSRKLRDSKWSKVLKEEHIKFSIRRGRGDNIDGIGFGLGYKFPMVKDNAFDLCYQIEENEWNDKISLQLMVKDIRVSE